MQDVFSLSMKVRDYECDLQGIVNNAVYLHYLEHARHEFLLSKGISFAELHNKGLDAVVVRVELDYKRSLRSGDKFLIETNIEKAGRLKIVFNQSIKVLDSKLVLKAKVFTALLKDGKPIRVDELFNKLV